MTLWGLFPFPQSWLALLAGQAWGVATPTPSCLFLMLSLHFLCMSKRWNWRVSCGKVEKKGCWVDLLAQCPDIKSKLMLQSNHMGKHKASGWERGKKLALCVILRRPFGLWLLPREGSWLILNRTSSFQWEEGWGVRRGPFLPNSANGLNPG